MLCANYAPFGATNTLSIIPSPRNFGVDVSHYQGASGVPQVNWNQMFTEGNRFAFIKATEGLTGPDDATMAVNLTGAANAGLLAGVYHFAHAENRPTTNGAIQEADHLLTYAGTAIGPGWLRPVLDMEVTSPSLPPAAMTDWVIAFCNEIAAQRGQGSIPVIYCSQQYANTQFDSRLANYDLWLAAGTSDNPLIDNPPTNGFPSPTGVFDNWSFWQYAIGSAGGISPIDLDVCHDDFKPLASFLIPAASPGFVLQALTLDSSGFHSSFTNVPGAHFTLLAATNSALPLSNWTVLNAVVEVSSGQFQFSDPQATNRPRRFYRLRSP